LRAFLFVEFSVPMSAMQTPLEATGGITKWCLGCSGSAAALRAVSDNVDAITAVCGIGSLGLALAFGISGHVFRVREDRRREHEAQMARERAELQFQREQELHEAKLEKLRGDCDV
jgi:hypothetical protein